MNTEHGNEDVRSFSKAANSDREKEFLGAKDNGEFISSRNARNHSIDGNSGSLEKIKGESVLYANSNLSSSYVCVGTANVRDQSVEFWASPVVGELDAIRVDGALVAENDDLLFDTERFLQLDTNDECNGGEVFITDNFTVPMIFNIEDLINSFATQKYFTEFNRKLYEINLETPVDKPVFTRLVTVGGGGGLPIGQYSYAIRYVNDDGDRTNLSPSTPLIPVVQSIGDASPEYPSTKTRGSSPNVSIPTSYGIELKFRVTNELNYDSIEIIRYAWNAGTQLGFSPDPKIIGRVNVAGTTISVITFVDPVESNIEESVPEDDIDNQLMFIERAKAIRYFDKRLVLMNYSVAERNFDPVFTERNNEVMFPIMDAMGHKGHKDPHNHTYKKNFPSGERFGFAINAYDGVSAKAFSVPIDGFGNYQFPNRRDELAAGSNSDIYSTGSVTAANTEGNVTKTFEVFDLEDTKGKDDVCSFKGILDGTNAVGTPEGTKSLNDVTQDCTDDPELSGGIKSFSVGTRVAAPYAVYHPTGDNDPLTMDHNYRINPAVGHGSFDTSYNPDMFGLNYFSKGIALNGVDKNSIPDWVKSFTVVRTERANRVVCQGLMMYSINPGDPQLIGSKSLATKDKDDFWFYSPDIAEGVVSESIVNDMKANPNNYKIEFVSPLGFASELYNFDQQTSGRDRCCDLMTYARVLKDGLGVGKIINPNEGVIGKDGYTAYNKYRNSESVNDDFFDNGQGGGNRVAQMTGFEDLAIGRGSYFRLTTQEEIYNHSTTGGSGNNDFGDDGMKDWTEPFYMINIIQEGASIVDQNIDTYKDTGAYVKMESVIGEGITGVNNLRFELVDERWEDCISALSSTDPTAGEDRFVYIRDAAGNDNAWLNVSYKNNSQINTIINDISTNGFHLLPSTIRVYGVYKHDVISVREIYLDFNVPGSDIIDTDRPILVKYDENAPIKIFGGDTTVGETIFSPIDMPVDVANWDVWNAGSIVAGAVINPFALGLAVAANKGRIISSLSQDKGFPLNVGFPFREYFVNSRNYILKDPNSMFDKIQASSIGGGRVMGKLYYIRQMCVSFTVESRIATHFAYNENYPNEFFPNTHYVMRPNTYSNSEFDNGAEAVYEDNSINPQYEEDYGDEYLNWQYGGFRFLQNHNIDYAQQNLEEFVSKPDFGFDEVTDFCTGVAWSLPRAVNQQDSPGLKTFQSLNSVQLEDAQGEINLAFDATTSKGSNIYSITDKGVCLLLHNKSILSDTSGTEIGLFKGNNFIQQEYWLDRNIGTPGELWRGAAEGSIGVRQVTSSGTEGEVQRIEALVFIDKNSIYRLVNNSVKDLGRDGYFSEINDFVKGIPSGQQNTLTAHYNEIYNEFLIQGEYQDPNSTSQILLEDSFVYSFNNSGWISNFDYRFDKYLAFKDRVFGMRDGESYLLNEGYEINGNPVVFEAETGSSVAPYKEKEFIRISANSNKIPTRIEFKDGEGQLLCALDQSIQGSLYLKKYDGYGQFIPRKDLTVSPGRERVQDRLLVYKIIHNLEEDFVLKDVVTTFKLII